MAQSFRGLRKFCKSRKFSDWDIPRAKSPRRQVRKFLASYFAPSRPFDSAQDMLCGKYSDSFGCGSAALGLCGECFFIENPE
jgi:hypothetical protein